jgi:glycosyltransferase involved in cell wall biosynthesis
MHILLIHQFFLEDHEGGGSRWNEMSRIWVEAGHQVTVLAGTMHYMQNNIDGKNFRLFEKTQNYNGVNVIRCHVSMHYHRGFAGRFWAYLSFIFSSCWAGVFHARANYDMILVTSPPLHAGVTALFLAWWKRIPIIMEVRDLWPESAIDTGILKSKFLIRLSFWFESLLYRKSKLINVLTPAFREVLINRKKINAEKIIEIPNAADFRLSELQMIDFNREEFRKELGLNDRFVIIYVGAHGIANCLEQILQTADILIDTNAFFLLIGSGGEKESLIVEAQRLQLNNVRFIDPVAKADIFKYILASDAGTSVLKNAETFKTVYSNKTFDYFACKRPVLMAIDGVSRKLVEQANAGIFVKPENPEDFALKIMTLMNNPELCQQLGVNGYYFAKKHFDRKILAQKYLQHLLDLNTTLKKNKAF